MRKKFVIGGILVLVALVLVVGRPAQSAPVAATATPDYAAIDKYVQAQIEDAHIPGLALGIVHGDQVVHLKGFGRVDSTGRAVTPQTPFFIGSVSKSMTALAVMQLTEAGMVDLDAPVQRYLPEFRVADAAASGRITVRQLLNQTSGIPTAAGIAPLSRPVTTLDAQVRALAGVAVTAQPGQRYQYSNSNYVVLGRLIEVVSGQAYGDYVQQRIFGPLDMRHSYLAAQPAKRDGLASGSLLWFGIPQMRAQGAGFRADTVPAGYVISSAEDMSHYVAAQLNGGRYSTASVLSGTGVTLLHTGAAPAGSGSYAMGWIAGPREHLANTVWHNGSAGGMHAMVVMLPAQDYGVVVLTNTESAMYEFLGRTDVIADNVAAMLTGQPLSGTLAGLYLAFDAAAVLVVGLLVRNLVRLLRGEPKRRTGPLARTRDIVFNWVLPTWREAWMPVAILVGLPSVTGAPWLGNLASTDLGQWLLVVALLLLASGVTRVTLAVRRRQQRPRAALEGAGGPPAHRTPSMGSRRDGKGSCEPVS